MEPPFHDASDRPAARAAVREQYAREAAAYERRWDGYLRATLGPTLEALAAAPGERVLDVGCGTGLLLRRIAAAEPGVVGFGVDLSEAMLRAAAPREPAHRVALGDAHALSFRAGTFDAVVSSSSLHHWSAPRTALDEIRRVLRPGGRLVVTDWADDHLPTRLLSLWLRFTDPSHGRTRTARELEALLRGAGFEVERRRLYRGGWRWGFVTLSARRRAAAR